MRNTVLGAAVLALGAVAAAAPGLAAEHFVGEIVAFGGPYCPVGWLAADGHVMKVDHENQALASIFANKYGGDGHTTFGLPNLKDTKLGTQSVTWCIALQGDFPHRP